MATEQRRRQIAAGLSAARERIAAAEVAAHRAIGSVELVVVTKTFPADDVAVLVELGVQHVGENRDQEAEPKSAALSGADLVWHFIGQLQTNKARSVVGYADVVESVDRLKLVGSLSRAAADLRPIDRPLHCLVQVCLDDQPGRGGAAPNQVPELAAAIASAPALVLGGVMAVAPLDADPDAAFSRLAEVARDVAGAYPGADSISAGMSGDLEAAIRHGATQVRLGSAVLGYRPPVG
ncbi:MAG: YggS family pyridoxal phosphate-dependent enzyme [Actinomycetia bacterium]|nr:YggS family pyridoxal phosphate-dependent enzyme [Actinomycetes bacterium]